MYKRPLAIALMAILIISPSAYADTTEDNLSNEEQNNTYNEPVENFDENNQDWNGQYQEEQSQGTHDYNNGYNDYNDGTYNDTDSYDNGNYNNNDDGYYNDSEHFNEEDIEEPVYEEEYIEPEPEVEPEPEPEPEPEIPVEVEESPEEEVEIQVNQVETESVRVSGTVVDEAGDGIENISLILEKDDVELEGVTDESGMFSFDEVESGEYVLIVSEADGYVIDEETTVSFEVGNRNKSDLKVILTEEEETVILPPSEVNAKESAAPQSAGHMSAMDWTLIGVGVIFLLTGVIIFVVKRMRA